MPLLNTSNTKIHSFWLAITLGSPKMAAALPAKRLYPTIAAFCNFDIVPGRGTKPALHVLLHGGVLLL